MANSYDVGDLITLTATFTNAPTAVIMTVQNPAGTVVTHTYGLSSQGNWNASTNSPTLADGTGTSGHYYTCNVAGTQTFGAENLTFVVNDLIYYNGYVWRKLTNVSSTPVTATSSLIYTVNTYLTNLPGAWWYAVDSAGAIGADENYFTVIEQQVS